jgi:hypothetical protein
VPSVAILVMLSVVVGIVGALFGSRWQTPRP